MPRVYRDGLEAMRRDFERKLRAAQLREDVLRADAGSLLARSRRESLQNARAELEREIDDLDSLTEAEDDLADYERTLKYAEDEVAAERDKLRRARLKTRALQVLAVSSLAIVGIGVSLWQAEQLRINEALAARSDRCQTRDPCLDRGLCTAKQRSMGEMVCAAGSDADCVRSKACTERGECRAEDGQCVLGSDEDCSRSTGCEAFGLCAAGTVQCVANANSCKSSAACKDFGWCTVVNGACAADREPSEVGDPSCRSETACIYHGQCTQTEAGCRAATAHDCTSSMGCSQKGRCKRNGTRCVVSDAGCKRTRECEFSGLCHADIANNLCVAKAP